MLKPQDGEVRDRRSAEYFVLLERVLVLILRRLLNAPIRLFRSCQRYLHFRVFRVLVILSVVLAVLFALFHVSSYVLEGTKLQKKIKLKSILGYPHCRVNSSTFALYSNKYKCNFKNLPKSKETIVVTFINSAWTSLAQNWVCSASKVGLQEHLYIITFEKGVCKNIAGAHCYEYPNSTFHETSFGEEEYQRLVIKRTEIILELLMCEYKTVLLVDTDVIFLKNPLQYVNRLTSDLDIVFQADTTSIPFLDFFVPYFFRYICGGFIYMKSNAATRFLWMSVLHYQTHYLWNDQAGFNVCIRLSSQAVQWNTLSSELFPNGPQFFSNRERSKKNMIAHANHLIGSERIIHMVASGLWCDHGTAVATCKNSTISNQCLTYPTMPSWCEEYFDVCKQRYGVDIKR